MWVRLDKTKLEKFLTDKDSTFDDLLVEDDTSTLDNLVDMAKEYLSIDEDDGDVVYDKTIIVMINEASSSINSDIDNRAQKFATFHQAIKRTQNQRRVMSDETKEKIRIQQLEITKKLRGEAINTLSKAKSKDVAIRAANNPKDFALLNHSSVAMIPKDMRSQIITNNSLMVGTGDDRNYVGLDPQLQQQKSGMNVSGFISGVAKNPMKLYSYYFMSTALIGLFLLMGRTIFGVVRFITNALMNNHIANSLFTCDSVVNKDTVENMIKKAQGKDPALINWLESNFGKTPEDRMHYYDTHNTFTNPDGTERENGIIRLPVGSRKEGYNFNDITNSFNYSLSVAVKYIAIAVAIVGCIMILYKYISNKINKKKRDQYATVNNMAQESVSIDMLKESNDHDREYYDEMDLLDEGISLGWLSKYTPTPTNILGIINRGIISTAALAKATEEGLESKTISPLLAKVCNFFIALGNTILLVAKGIMLGIISVTNGKTSSTIRSMAQ